MMSTVYLDDSNLELFAGNKYWHINGILHREDGPAVETLYGESQWFYHGKRIDCSTQEEFERIIKLIVFW